MSKSSSIKKDFKLPLSAIIASLICIIAGLVLGFLFLLGLKSDKAWSDGFIPIIQSGFRMVSNPALKKAGMNWSTVGQEIVNASPLIMTGLSVAFAFKMGLFNIGAAGQYTLGVFGALFCAIVLKWPWYLCLLAATIAGALWGMIPGIFKAFLNVNEVISAIMFNWIGLYLVNFVIYGRGKGPMFNQKQAKTYTLASINEKALIPQKFFGINVNVFKYGSMSIAIILAIIVAIVIYVILNKTTFGYELKACGNNKDAARYAGINDKRNIIISMMIAGALAGFGAGLYYLSGAAQWDPQNSTALPSEGFDGISVALLAMLNPIGCIFSGLFISHLSTGGAQMTQTLFPSEIADVISGIIIYLCAFSGGFQKTVYKFISKKDKKSDINAEDAVVEETEEEKSDETESDKNGKEEE